VFRAAKAPDAEEGGLYTLSGYGQAGCNFASRAKQNSDIAEKNCTSALYITIIISTAKVKSLCPFSFTQLAECHILSKPRRKAIHHRMAWTEM
jgi:hypothetical protein